MPLKPRLPIQRAAQRGLTLIEFMISIVLGMILVAALAVLIANQSTSRAEVDRAGRIIENGRYAMGVIADDLVMAGYLGELNTTPTAPASISDPCPATVTLALMQAAMGLHVQGYDDSTYTSGTASCVSNWKSGTDVLVVRHADPDTTGVVTTSSSALSGSLSNGQMYLQTGLTSSTSTTFNSVSALGDSSTNAATFTLVNKSGTLMAPRKWLVRVYWIASCDICSPNDGIPTLKRSELGVTCSGGTCAPTFSAVTIAEGIENLQIDYGVDNDGSLDGYPDTDVNAADTALGVAGANWQNAMSARVYLLARSTDSSPGTASVNKTFCMGTSYSGAVGHPCYAPTDNYQRHLFTQSVRLANPSLRRSS
jgi:type IV pilus assembly protein PilW